jgi:hypothetical protein
MILLAIFTTWTITASVALLLPLLLTTAKADEKMLCFAEVEADCWRAA